MATSRKYHKMNAVRQQFSNAEIQKAEVKGVEVRE
jgi:hypothetical protein